MSPESETETPAASPELERRHFLMLAGMSAAVGTIAAGAGRTPARGASVAGRAGNAANVLDVAIIGAGLAGLTAARDLVRAGCDSFTVIEARNRVGGRTYNHQLGHGIIAEGGGQWIGPSQTAIIDLARELNVGTFDTYYQGQTVSLSGNSRIAVDLQGGLGVNPEIIGKLNQLARGVQGGEPWKAADAAKLDTMSVADWLSKQRGLSNDDKAAIAIGTSLSGGADPSQIGLLQYLAEINASNCDYEQLESTKPGSVQQSRFVGGSQSLSLKMAQDLRAKIKFSSPVRKISGWNRDVVEIQTDRGVIRARSVIAALSPALCNQIAFDPPLPAGRAELQRRWPVAPMRKTVHVYPKPFWREDGLNGQIVEAGGPLLMTFDNSPPDGQLGVITAFVVPGLLPRDSKRAEQTLSAIYVRALGEKARHPTQYHDIDWGTVDPWSLSCVPPIPPGFWTKWGRFLRPPVGRLIWSGTETAELWAVSMDGAVRSGHHAALQALNALTHA